MPHPPTKWKMISLSPLPEEYAESLHFCQASGYKSMAQFALCGMRVRHERKEPQGPMVVTAVPVRASPSESAYRSRLQITHVSERASG